MHSVAVCVIVIFAAALQTLMRFPGIRIVPSADARQLGLLTAPQRYNVRPINPKPLSSHSSLQLPGSETYDYVNSDERHQGLVRKKSRQSQRSDSNTNSVTIEEDYGETINSREMSTGMTHAQRGHRQSRAMGGDANGHPERVTVAEVEPLPHTSNNGVVKDGRYEDK